MKIILSVLAIVLCLGVAITNCRQGEELSKTEKAKVSEHNLRIEIAYRVFVFLHNKYGKFVRHGIILEMCDQKDLASLFELSGSEVPEIMNTVKETVEKYYSKTFFISSNSFLSISPFTNRFFNNVRGSSAETTVTFGFEAAARASFIFSST